MMALNRQVLVLNKHWMAVHVCTARRALTLVYQELARIVAEDFRTYDFDSWRELSSFAHGDGARVHAPGFDMLLPEVIVLARYHRNPPRRVKFNRRNIFMRDRHACQYCGKRPKDDDMTIDHVLPRSRGGHTAWENVVLACTQCNVAKGSRLPEECGMKLLRPPKRPNWIAMQLPRDADGRDFWQKFIDLAYWESNLRE
jgi:5-methylcytosine-specific restriction endonuclease McrA